ncbi:MAG: GGDEF domain-containing protein [Halopseudomonas sp.]|uniref:GGDEF domain-containing protein n=1 Tax=Halopseudomonas sp. TaxID=2901191 RepID=UPI0030038834
MSDLWGRLKSDFQLSIVTLVGICSVFGVTPYAVYRLHEGNWLVGFTDTFLVLGTSFAVLYAWRTGNTVRPGQFLAIIYSLGGFLVTIKLGINGLFWLYCLVLFNFFVVPPVQSLIATLTTLVAVCIYGWQHPGDIFESHYQMMSFVVTYLLASLFAFVFAYRSRFQRRQLALLATLDPLTGIGNRRTMDEELDIAIADSQRYGMSFGLLVLDLDHFKSVNDRFGHSVGDRVLIDFVGVIKNASRASDRIFRLGGEEFVLLVPKVGRQGLAGTAAHIQRSVAEQLSSPGGPVTVSIGGCVLEGQTDRDIWLRDADICLYQAKDAGRNRTVIKGFDPAAN